LGGKPKPGSGEDARQVLTFTLGAEIYGVDIGSIREIRGWSPVTRIPNAPGHVLGVMNLRGSIAPILDLRRQFRLERAEYTPLTVIIVLAVQTATGRREFGVVVDGVGDVVALDGDAIEPAPQVGSRAGTGFICGLARIGERLVILLDSERLQAGITDETTPLPLATT
jgi:purine-binding chemotaxis protein CheW